MAPRVLRFGDLRFDLTTRELARAGPDGSVTPLPIGSRAADMLLLLLDRPGDLVSKREIMSAVWPDTAVEDSNLTVQISALRRALDGGREGASAIATVPGRGYRFTLTVQAESAADTAQASGTMSAATDASASRTGVDAPLQHRFGLARIRTWTVQTWAALGAGVMLVALAALALRVASVAPQSGNPQQCRDGLVVRGAFAGDTVCVTQASHDQAIADNLAAASHARPGGGCMPGYVWREAGPNDHVCVLPATREQIRDDNWRHCRGDIRCSRGPMRAP